MKIPQTTLATALLILIFGFVRQGISQELASAEKVYSPPLVKTLESGETEIELQQVLPAPTTGTFHPISGSFPPMPMAPNPELGLPIYFWNEGVFLFDDEGLDTKILREAGIPLFNTGHSVTKAKGGALLAMSDGPPAPGEGEGGEEPEQDPLPLPFSYTNGLWLDIYSYDSNWLTLELHGTVENGFYEILTKTNLSEPAWAIDHGVIGFDGLTLANAISVVGKSNFFFWARNSGQDEDGDGLPDWWETENGLDATLSDTGNTGTSDGYKDTDNDGWTNLEEFQNGTSPSGFNTPPAPRGLTVSLNSSGTVANLSWNPSGGAVTGYTIERVYDFDTDSFSIAASAQTFSDSSTPVHDIPFPPPVYRIRANYAGGNSAWSPYVSVHPAATSGGFWLVRGPGGLPYLISSAVSSDVTAFKVTRAHWNGGWEYYTFTIPLSNVVNGVALLTPEQVPINDWYWAQTVTADGTAGEFTEIDRTSLRTIPYLDGREQLKQNLNFILRAADQFHPFQLRVTRGGGNTYYFYPFDYAYAGFYDWPSIFQEVFTDPSMHEMRPFDDNYIHRNFVLDFAYLNSDGKMTNGVYRDFDYHHLINDEAAFRFEPPTNAVTINPILSPSESIYVMAATFIDRIGVTIDIDLFDYVMDAEPKNIFGLSYLSAREPYLSFSNGMEYVDLFPGLHAPIWANYLYPQPVQPILHTIDYYFARPDLTPTPGHRDFSPTNNLTPLMIISGNNPFHSIDELGAYFYPFRVAGYAKKSIDNGDTNKFAYLGLYFDKAYKMNTNGMPSTNETGILSEYGEFFPTEPGRAILTTKPESIGETNIGGCIVDVIKLELDVNHDGMIDPSITGPDNTSYLKPFVFWVNDDRDHATNDVQIPKSSEYADCRDDFINSQRDLEDFIRLWISGVPALTTAAGYEVSLGWENIVGTPRIRLYRAWDSGTGYLTDTNMAAAQLTSISIGGQTINFSQSLGEIVPGNEFTLSLSAFGGLLRTNFLFEGTGIGSGNLVLTIKKDSQPIATTSQYIEIKDIRDLYEQAIVTNVIQTWPEMVQEPMTSSFRVTKPFSTPSASKEIAVFVHGWRLTEWDYYNFSETMFKRLYWQGFQGGFASLRWPTRSADTDTNGMDLVTYNRSEHIAFKSGIGAALYFHDLRQRFTNHTISVCAHSQGNIVMMEALNTLVAVEETPLDNYVMMQAAVPAHCYDTTVTNLPLLITKETSSITPNTYSNYAAEITDALREDGKIINFFNTNDFALATGTTNVLGIDFNISWEGNQELFKPLWPFGYGYDATNEIALVVNTNQGVALRAVTDAHELMPFVARPRSKAVGAQGGAGGVINGGELDLANQLNFTKEDYDHSGQFHRNIQTPQVQQFYFRLNRALIQGQP